MSKAMPRVRGGGGLVLTISLALSAPISVNVYPGALEDTGK